MIDIYNQVFTKLYEGLKSQAQFKDLRVEDEHANAKPKTMPAVTVAETRYDNVRTLNDNSGRERYVRLRYRVRIYSNKQNSRKAEARAIFDVADRIMWNMGFRRLAFTSTPELYESTTYGISAEYGTVADETGTLYRNQ